MYTSIKSNVCVFMKLNGLNMNIYVKREQKEAVVIACKKKEDRSHVEQRRA